MGNLKTEGLEDVFNLFSAEVGGSKNAEYLKDIFQKSYLQHDNLTEATRYLANELFKQHGLVIIDGDDQDLKREFLPYLKSELFDQASYKSTKDSIEKLEELGYGVQVNPREINLFYLHNGLRERLIEQDGRFYVNETEISWSREEMEQELENYPWRFSPNVITRPLYEEVIFPNLWYICGGGELAYLFELKK